MANRMHPGKPPSQRRDWPGDWRERLRTTTRSFVAKIKEEFECGDDEVREIIVRAVRLSLGGETQPSRDDMERAFAESEESGDVMIIGMAKAFNLFLDGEGINRSDAIVIETFMEVVTGVLDGELGLGWRSKLQIAVELMAQGVADDDQGLKQVHPRARLIEAIRKSFQDVPSSDFMVESEFLDDDGGTEEAKAFTTPGLFRFILDTYDLKYRTRGVQESFMAAALAAFDEISPGQGNKD
jgi:hypothetical protein